MGKPDWIEPFAESSYQLFIHHDPQSHLPFDAWGLHLYYNELWLGKIFELIAKFKEKNYQAKDYLDYFPNLSSTRFIVLMNMIHYQTSKMENPELITAIQDFFVESIKLRAKKDIFALESNIEYSEEDIEKLLNEKTIYPTTLEESKELGKILVALASLTHGLYNDWCTDYDYEISGPYQIGSKMYLIRTFPDTKPMGIWPEIAWPYEDFSIITEYQDLEAKIAFVGCHINYSGNAVEKLSGYNLMVNGEEINGLDELKKLRDKLMPIASEQYEKFINMDFEAQKIKFLEQEGYQLKKLFELVGMDWKPSEEMIAKIKGKELIKDVFPSYEMTLEKYKENFGVNKLINAYENN